MTLSYAEKQRIRGMLADKHRAGVGHCHTEVSRSCSFMALVDQRAGSDTNHVGSVKYRRLLLTQPSSVP